MEFHVTENGGPRWRQLAQQLAAAIERGEFGESGRLPTCEALSAAAGVSPGTVKAAWAELTRQGLITRTRGSGVYAAGSARGQAGQSAAEAQPREPRSQKPANEPDPDDSRARAEQAAEALAQALLAARGITAAEAFGMFRQVLAEECSGAGKIRAAWVDCTEETLHATLRQLSGIEQLSLTPFLQDDLFLQKAFIGPEYEIVLTTSLHFADVTHFLAPLHLNVEQIGLRETRATIEALSTVPEGETICILYRSPQLLSSIRYTLGVLGRENPQVCAREAELDSAVQAHIRAGCTVIIPPDYREYSGVRTLQSIERAHKCGCRVIPFEFEVDRGSILHLRQRLTELRRERRAP